MKKLKILAAAALLAGAAVTAAAQEPQAQGQRAGGGNRMAALMQGITLTAEQQTKFDEITKKYAEARQAMMQDQSLDQDARRAKGREAMTKQSEEIKALLTDEQKKVFEKNLADMQARMQGGGGRPPQF
ncbi:MAG TPA: Spy/CpxP family protein refolding chaperone [Gemmatimonadaceae bacterium]|nr:Spy/CpxP family protein refolding chaperone [Gemmatimonadaceae bacterium]